MNHVYRVIWNASTGVWQAASELQCGRCKSLSTRRARRTMAAAALALAAGAAGAADVLPTAGTVVAGTAAIARNGAAMTITQSTGKLAIDWNSFSIGAGNTVQFLQPSSSSVALNRVTGADVSHIQGALKANGQVFLLNPNGVLFSPTAQVNVGALLASTLEMSNADFGAGRYRLAGASGNAVINQGNLHADAGGAVALVAAKVTNNGAIGAQRGSVLLGAGSDVLVDFGGPVKLAVDKGAVDALIDNGGAIRADGGNVVMKASAAGALMSTVINNTGVIEARTLSTGEQGQILLLGDMGNGRIEIGGRLDASAPNGGNGGFIETSAAQVGTGALAIDAGAVRGKGGEWLIDPYDYTINAAAAANIVNALNTGTSVTVSTQASASGYGGGASGSGDITVASPIAKTAGGNAALTLRADRNILVNSAIGSSAGKLDLTLSSANAAGATVGGIDINADISTNGGKILLGGANGTVTNGIGFALNLNNASGAIVVEQNRKILSQGGNITINGRSQVGSNNGSYGGTTAGVYVKSGATIMSGLGNMAINGVSAAGSKTFGFAVEANSNTVTTLGSGTDGGSMLLNAVNVTPGYSQAELDKGAIGLVAYGSRDRVFLQGPSVAAWLVFVNGVAQLSAYEQSPQLSGCATPYPNCGTLVIPGSNNSYLYATYQSVSMATQALYAIKSGNGTKVYDGTTTATGVTINTLGGPAGFTTGSINPALAFNIDSKNVGVYDSVSAASANPTTFTSGGVTYAIGYFGTGTYTVTPKALTPIAASKQYDGTTAAAITASGLVAGDSAILSGAGAFAGKDVGSYNVSVTGITLSGADAANYSLGSNSATATASITPRQLTLSASKVYDGSASMGSVTLGNLAAGETLIANGALANSAHVTGASYISAIGLADGTGMASNYALPALTARSASNSAAVTPKALAITGLAAANKTYDGTTAAVLNGGVLSGLAGSETLGIGSLAGAFSDANAGIGKSVSLSAATLVDGSGLASDYTVTSPSSLSADIARRTLSVSGITSAGKVYDGLTGATVSTGAALLSNLVAGDAVGVTASGNFTDANAANGKTVNLLTSLTGSAAANYTLAGQATATASIAPKSLTLTGMNAADKVYDGTTTATIGGGSLTGLVGTETLGFSVAGGAFDNKNAGTVKAVTVGAVTLSNGTGLASNYALAGPSALSASIARRALNVSGIVAADKVYDGGTSAMVGLAGATLGNLISGDLVTLAATGAFNDANAGNAKAVSLARSLGGADAGNYVLAGQAGTSASITPKALTIIGLAAADKVYDGGTGATVTGGVLNGLVGAESLGFTVSGASFADKNAGSGKTVTTGTMSLTDGTGLASNYTVATPASLLASITRRALNVSGIAAADKIYDGATTATVDMSAATLGNLVGGDTVSIAATGSFIDARAGAGKSVMLDLVLGGADAANYSRGGQTSAAASITPKTLTVTGTAIADKSEDGSTVGQIARAGAPDGVIQGDMVALTSDAATAAFAQSTPGLGIAVQVAGLGLSGADAGNYSLPAHITASGNILAAPVITPPVTTPPVVETPPVVTPPVVTPPVVETPPVVTPPVITPPVVDTPPVVVTPPVVTTPPVVETPPVVTPPVVETPPVVTPPVIAPPVADTPPVVVTPPVVTMPPVVQTPPVVTPPVITPPVVDTPPVVVTPPVVTPPVVTPPVVLTPPAVTPPVVVAPPVVVPAPAPAVNTMADAARYAAVLPALPAAAIGGMTYTAVADPQASTAPASGSTGSTAFADSRGKQPATQGNAAGRDVKFLSVFVVGGGIQLPPVQATEDGRAPADPATK